MKSRGLFLAFIALAVASLACNLSLGTNTSPTPTPAQPVVEPVGPTPTLAAPTQMPPTVAAPADTLAPTQPLPPTPAATVQAPVVASAIVLAMVGTQPAPTTDLRVVDAVTGLTQATFQASGLSLGPYPLVAGKSIFFTDADSMGVHRVGFDGQAQDLTYITTPDQKVFEGTFLPSPDGTRIVWSNVLSEDASGTHVQLIVANVDGSEQKTLIDETRPQPSRPEPVRWSNDGKSVFYTNMPYGIGGYILFYGGPDLDRVDLTSGQSTQIVASGCLCATVVSPDETKVAYLQKPEADQMNVFVRGLSGGTPLKASLPANHFQAGAIVWSPDSQSFLVTSALGVPEHEAFTVLLFHAADMSSKVLIPDDPRSLQPVIWPAPGVVWLNDNQNNAWRMDPSTGTLTQSSNGERPLSGTR
jgi:Tol biopolymer transport system component